MQVFVIGHKRTDCPFGVASSRQAADQLIEKVRFGQHRSYAASEFYVREFDLFTGPRIIKGVRFDGAGFVQVVAILEDGVEEELFGYYSDELSFSESELVGKSVDAARDMRHQRDVAYLRS